MTTRDKITEVSLLYFNKKGVDNVSVRDICSDLNISVGNFHYHFPNKDSIVVQLYQRMLSEMQGAIGKVSKEKVSIITFLESHKVIFQIQQKYKFFFLNLFDILMKYEEIRKIYIRNAKVEKQLAKELLRIYVERGVLKKNIVATQFDRMINVGQMLNNSWIIDAEIIYEGNIKEKLAYYMTICCGLLEPYLTATSLKEYNDYFSKLQTLK